MNATPTQSDLVDAIGHRWVAVAAFGALACALSPILPLLAIVSWAAVFEGTFPAGIVRPGSRCGRRAADRHIRCA
jgi:hypothetical protein